MFLSCQLRPYVSAANPLPAFEVTAPLLALHHGPKAHPTPGSSRSHRPLFSHPRPSALLLHQIFVGQLLSRLLGLSSDITSSGKPPQPQRPCSSPPACSEVGGLPSCSHHQHQRAGAESCSGLEQQTTGEGGLTLAQ